jgi:hypothetical protein
MRDEIRRIGNTICVNGMPVADLRLRKNGLERGHDWFFNREAWLQGDVIYVDGDPVADIRPTARPYERDALANWLDPDAASRRHRDNGVRHQGMVHQSHFAGNCSPFAMAGVPATNAP